MEQLAVGLLGVAAGFATAVWLIVGVTSIRLHSWWVAACYAVLVLVNVAATGIITGNLIGRSLSLPAGVTTIILLPIMIIPPLLALRSWRSTRKVVGGHKHG